MSVQATSWVIKHSPHKGSELLCLIMISDHASPDGTNAYPSIKTLAAECRMSERQVTRIVHRLEESGAISVDRSSGRTAHVYTVNMSGLETVNIDTLSGLNDDKKSGLRRKPTLTNRASNPDTLTRNPDILDANPDILALDSNRNARVEPIEPFNPVEPSGGSRAREQPHDLVAAYLSVIGKQKGDLAPAFVSASYGHCEWLLAQGFGAERFRRFLLYRKSRNRSMEWRWIREDIMQWEADGEPDGSQRPSPLEPPPRAYDVVELPNGITYNRYR